MTTFSQHVEDYLQLRRSFGYKLDEAARLLPRFAARLEAAGAEFVTIDLALAWALEPEVPPGASCPRCGCSSSAALPASWRASSRGPRSRRPTWSRFADAGERRSSTATPTSLR
jgi:hypothetical protein